MEHSNLTALHPVEPVLHCAHHAKGHAESVCANCRVRSISVCSVLEQQELHGLATISEDAHYVPRAEIVVQGAPAHAIYNITEGTVRTYRLLPDGRRQIFGFLVAGDFMGLSFGETFSFSADAISQVRACRFSRPRFEAFLDTHPNLLRRLHEAAGHELQLAQDHMVLLGRRTAEEKVAGFLIGLRNRLQRIGGGALMIPLPMTREDIADYLGLTIETVSRVFTKLVRQRALIIVPGGVRLITPDSLTALAG
jgi:CRP/FNR family transcriptional regulator